MSLYTLLHILQKKISSCILFIGQKETTKALWETGNQMKTEVMKQELRYLRLQLYLANKTTLKSLVLESQSLYFSGRIAVFNGSSLIPIAHFRRISGYCFFLNAKFCDILAHPLLWEWSNCWGIIWTNLLACLLYKVVKMKGAFCFFFFHWLFT